MSTIKENIANNITSLRKSKNWTQAELAELLNYSDKTISKWERGESTPDVEIIYQMSQLFDVPIDYFFKEPNENQPALTKKTNEYIFQRILQFSLLIISAYFVGLCFYVYSKIGNVDLNGSWISFIWPLPAIGILGIIYARRYKLYFLIPYSMSFTLWTLLLSIFLQFLILGKNIWLIFLIGAPLQLAIIITFWLKK